MQANIDITWWQLGSFMLVLIVPLLINYRFSLGLSKDISIAVIRMFVQLILVGVYLQFLFHLNSLLLNILWLVIMILIGASAIINSSKLPFKYLYVPVVLGLLLGLAPLLALLLISVLTPSPIYSAQYLIPLAGMLLGNCFSGNIIALQRLFNALKEQYEQYEGALALGATPIQASYAFVQSAMQQSLAPILATMTTTGLVTLPGMMTGQILGGVSPIIAIKYQLMILIAIFVMLSISVTTCLYLSVRSSISKSGLIRVKTQ